MRGRRGKEKMEGVERGGGLTSSAVQIPHRFDWQEELLNISGVGRDFSTVTPNKREKMERRTKEALLSETKGIGTENVQWVGQHMLALPFFFEVSRQWKLVVSTPVGPFFCDKDDCLYFGNPTRYLPTLSGLQCFIICTAESMAW